MRLPQHLVESRCFSFGSVDDFLLAYDADEFEQTLIHYLDDHGLPPVTSAESLATLLGVNAGIIWSFVNRKSRHYRSFTIPKGKGERKIDAPRVGLKIVQTWLSYHLAEAYRPPETVFGFVPGRSHILAAIRHAGADWAFSVDIANFFQSTPQLLVEEAYRFLGYEPLSAQLLANLSCLNGALPQGAPTSPPLSNICFRSIDQALEELARQFGLCVTRYADDIVFSGNREMPSGLREAVQSLFAGTPWELNETKTRVEPLKGRIKVHGLLVHNGQVRLTKGYRNKIRAYQHILRTREEPANVHTLIGHVEYARHVSSIAAEYGAGHQGDLIRLPSKELIKDHVKFAAEARADQLKTSKSLLTAIRNLFR